MSRRRAISCCFIGSSRTAQGSAASIPLAGRWPNGAGCRAGINSFSDRFLCAIGPGTRFASGRRHATLRSEIRQPVSWDQMTGSRGSSMIDGPRSGRRGTAGSPSRACCKPEMQRAGHMGRRARGCREIPFFVAHFSYSGSIAGARLIQSAVSVPHIVNNKL